MPFSPLVPGTPPGAGEVAGHYGATGIVYVTAHYDLAPAQEVPPQGFKILEALTYAFGKELQFLGGGPKTRLVRPLTYLDPFMRVESTLGFPRAGTVFVGKTQVSYTSKTETKLYLAEPFPAFMTFNTHSPVTLITALVTPDGAGTGSEVIG